MTPRPRIVGSSAALVWRPLLAMAGLILVLLPATGCVRYHARPISLTKSLDDFESRSLAAPELKGFLRSRLGQNEWPPAWDLRSLTLVAIYYHPDMDVARAQWGVAQAGRRTAGEIPNPALSLLMGYNSTTPAPEVNPWIPEADLDIPVETAGKRGYRIVQARHLAEAARLNVLSAAWEVRDRLRQAFIDLFAAEEAGEILSRQLALQAQGLAILETQLAAGEVSAYDVTQARIALENGRLAELAADQERAQARVRLASALGLPPRSLAGTEFAFDGLRKLSAGIPSAEARRRALIGRSDILAALAEYEAIQSALRLEVARQYPDINLGPGFQFDQTDNKWTLGLSLVLPLLNRNRGPIAEAEARRSEAAARFLALQAQVVGQVDGAVAGLRAASEKVRSAGELRADLARQEAIARSRYALGEISRLELIGVELELAASDQAALEALVQAQRSAGELENAMQNPLDSWQWALEVPGRGQATAKEQKHE
jgi:cobalt-zinc-cadmium efflux system outer membrane protein